MSMFQRVLLVDPATGFYKIKKYGFDRYFGPVDLGIHLAEKLQSLNFGVGVFAGSILPGSNRMIVTGFSPCWQGYYISSMGGAGLVFNNLGINMLSLIGKAPVPSVLCLNRNHGEEIEVDVVPIDIKEVWKSGRTGVYALTDRVYEMFGDRYEKDPRILVTGPAAQQTDIGGIMSVPIKKGKISHVDTWAGRGGFGSALVQNHGIYAIIYGGTLVDEDFTDEKVADEWFQNKYNQRLMQKDLEVTTKYRYDKNLETGGTFGVNYQGVGREDFSIQLSNHLLERRRAPDLAPELDRGSLPQAVQRRDNRQKTAVQLRGALRGCLQEDARRVQEGLRALPDHGTSVRHLRSAGSGKAQPPCRRHGIRRHLRAAGFSPG